MSNTALKVLAGAGGAGDPVYVDDVFSTFLYEGNGTSQTITSGIDLDGEGGLVWTKARENTSGGATGHALIDTARGKTKWLSAEGTGAEQTNANLITAFNSNGHTVGSGGPYWTNDNGYDYVSWTFRKQAGFFDVVTYTGDGNAGRTVNHNLGSVPGFMVVKKTNSTSDWTTYHRSMGATKYAPLNDTDKYNAGSAIWNDTEPTATQFTVGDNTRMNNSGDSYVAYLFAHDTQDYGTDSDEAIIKCDSYTGNGSTTSNDINVGFEPQWILIKNTSSNNQWFIFDVMRGIGSEPATDAYLLANSSGAEVSSENYIDILSTGFSLRDDNAAVNANGSTYAYIAIRRPHKPASEFAATALFAPQTYTGDGSTRVFTGLSTTPDMTINKSLDVIGDANAINDRSRGSGQESYTNGADAEYSAGSAGMQFDYTNGIEIQSYRYTNTKDYINYHFKRAPGFFDIVAYTGATGAQSRTHNLGAVPEMIWVKKRASGIARNWAVYHSGSHATTPQNYYLVLNNNGQAYESSQYWNNTAPTASVFTTGGSDLVNGNENTYVAYLFASVDGISKVGTYTGTGSDVNVDCGFSSGARWVMVKSTGSGDWYVWDSARGIAAGNDPYWLLNSNSAEATGNDYIDPLSSGFTITSSAPTALNNSGDTYIFWAIA